MNLKEIQTGYLDLLKGRRNSLDFKDEYFREVAESKNFRVLNDIVIYWRAHGIREYCAITSELLIKLDKFQEKVESFYRDINFSGYIEELGKTFLQYLSDDDDKLISFVSRFELALINVNLGSDKEYSIESDFEPDDIFRFILDNGKYPEQNIKKFLVIVSERLENFYTVEVKE